MQFAHFAYDPGMYEILGPPDCDLPRYAQVQEGYTTPSVLGFKLRATYHPWLTRSPIVTAHLHEGMIVWLAPEHRVPFMLPTGETRVYVCFGAYDEEQHWGWITSDPYADQYGQSYPWIKKMSDNAECVTEHLPRVYLGPNTDLGEDMQIEWPPGLILSMYNLGHSVADTVPNLATTRQASVAQRASIANHHCKDEEASGDDDDVHSRNGETNHSTDVADETCATHSEEPESGPPADKAKKFHESLAAVRQLYRNDDGEDKDQVAQRNRTVAAHKISQSRELRRKQATKMSELARINSLNLEPGLTRGEITPRGTARAHRIAIMGNETSEGDRKKEFQHSLDIINKRQVDKERHRQKQAPRHQQQPQDVQESESSSASPTPRTEKAAQHPLPQAAQPQDKVCDGWKKFGVCLAPKGACEWDHPKNSQGPTTDDKKAMERRKTQDCHPYLRGECNRGSNCSFLHDPTKEGTDENAGKGQCARNRHRTHNRQQQQQDQESESSSRAGSIKPYSELRKQAQERLGQKTRQQLQKSAQAPRSSRGSSSHQAHVDTPQNRKGLYAWQ